MAPEAGYKSGSEANRDRWAACGASHRASYSVAQVESAFAHHRIYLVRAKKQETRGVVELLDASGVVAIVDPSGVRNYSYIVAGFLLPANEVPVKQGDLIVYAVRRDTRAVNAALRELRQ